MSKDLHILYSNPNQWSVKIEDAAEWCGFKRKEYAVQKLKNNFQEGLDYVRSEDATRGGRGRPSHTYLMTPTALKSFALLAKTEKGDLLRSQIIQLTEAKPSSAVIVEPADKKAVSLEFVNRQLEKGVITTHDLIQILHKTITEQEQRIKELEGLNTGPTQLTIPGVLTPEMKRAVAVGEMLIQSQMDISCSLREFGKYLLRFECLKKDKEIGPYLIFSYLHKHKMLYLDSRSYTKSWRARGETLRRKNPFFLEEHKTTTIKHTNGTTTEESYILIRITPAGVTRVLDILVLDRKLDTMIVKGLKGSEHAIVEDINKNSQV